MNGQRKTQEEQNKIMKDTENSFDAKSENLIIDEHGKPHPYKPGVAEKLENDCGDEPAKEGPDNNDV